ncbi:MAG: hypothetical protein U0470_03610 [Anaerolineae bacterium]
MDELAPWMIAESRVIARGRRIREVQRLAETYGGRVARWVKKSGPRFEVVGREFEFHWYEHPGIGRVEVKRKEVS